MKILNKLIKKHQHLLFLDFEGTQFSHELIAFGAIKVKLGRKNKIIHVSKGIKFYVKPHNPIGSYVKRLTSIDEEILEQKGITYKEALEEIQKYCGESFEKDFSFCFFGTHDLRILHKSFENSPDADKKIIDIITKNYIDVQAVLSMFVRDQNNNPLSLTHGLEFFNISLKGEPHDPLIDAIHLMHLYKGILKNHDKLYSEYLRILPKQKTLPIPIKNVINDLINGKTVTPNDFEKYVKDYIE